VLNLAQNISSSRLEATGQQTSLQNGFLEQFLQHLDKYITLVLCLFAAQDGRESIGDVSLCCTRLASSVTMMSLHHTHCRIRSTIQAFM
jgi:predicted YcjX-like family ATPase